MNWTVELDAAAHRDLQTLDHAMQQRLVRFLRTRIAGTESPRRVISGQPSSYRRQSLLFLHGNNCSAANHELGL